MPLRLGPIASGRSVWHAAQAWKSSLPCSLSAAKAAVETASAAPITSINERVTLTRLPLDMNKRPRCLDVLIDDRLGGPIRERADRARRVIAVLLREHRRAHDE